jgi:hypothetical protein
MTHLIGWILYGVAVLLVLRDAYNSFWSHRGMRILIVAGPSTLLATLSMLVGAVTWPFVIPIVVVDLAAWGLQRVAFWPL